MANLTDLAALILHHRHAAEKQFDSQICRLKVTFGDRAVGKAMQIAERQSQHRAEISVSAARARHEAQRAIERRAQRAFRQQHQHDDEPSERLPPGWK